MLTFPVFPHHFHRHQIQQVLLSVPGIVLIVLKGGGGRSRDPFWIGLRRVSVLMRDGRNRMGFLRERAVG